MPARMSNISVVALSFYLLLPLIGLTGCSSSEPVKVGMIAGLTGRASEIGIAGRDGALLAVEEANRDGGIDGRRIELIIRDDKQDRQNCQKAITEIIQEKVVGVVGPMTSSMAMVVVPETNRFSLPTISPTVSTELLADKDDYFFRIIPVSTNAAEKTADYLYNIKNYRNILVIYDMGNNGYTEPLFLTLKKEIQAHEDGKIQGLKYISKNGYDFFELAKKASAMKMDCLVILASSLDTALISQQLAKLDINVAKIAFEWSLTEDIIEYGGRAVEGIEIFHSFDRNDKSIKYLEFSNTFLKRYGYPADFASAYAYNATKILLHAIKNASTPEQIKKNILNGSPYEGVQHQILFNKYGDAERKYTLLRIKNGRIISIGKNV